VTTLDLSGTPAASLTTLLTELTPWTLPRAGWPWRDGQSTVPDLGRVLLITRGRSGNSQVMWWRGMPVALVGCVSNINTGVKPLLLSAPVLMLERPTDYQDAEWTAIIRFLPVRRVWRTTHDGQPHGFLRDLFQQPWFN